MLDVGTRKFPRFESNIMMFFRPIKKTNDYIVGRMRNFSSAGFSFESENYEIKPKEDLEFKLKHSLCDLFLVQGKVVWNKKSELACVAGIELKELDKATRKKMLEIVPVTGNIPDDSFYYGKDKESVVTEREDIKSEEEPSGKEYREVFKELINDLNTKDMLFLKLYYEKELPPKEIAEMLNLTVSTVYSKKNRAREKLKRIAIKKNLLQDN